jgi:stress-induced morphogen
VIEMATVARGTADQGVQAVLEALNAYESQFIGSSAAVYRQNPGTLRVRIVDDRFAGMPRSRRHDDVWKYLSDRVAEDVMTEISALTLLPKAELRSSLANLEFEDPIPSQL